MRRRGRVSRRPLRCRTLGRDPAARGTHLHANRRKRALHGQRGERPRRQGIARPARRRLARSRDRSSRRPIGYRSGYSRSSDAACKASRPRLVARSRRPASVATSSRSPPSPQRWATTPRALEDLCEELASQGAPDRGDRASPNGPTDRSAAAIASCTPCIGSVLYESIAESRRIRMHRAIGIREEAGFGARAGERASQLALHFTRGHDWRRALVYHELAASAGARSQRRARGPRRT